MLNEEVMKQSLMDILGCSEDDLEVLDYFYSSLASDVDFEPRVELRETTLDESLYSLYTNISISVQERLEEVIDEYLDTLNSDGSVSEDTKECTLISDYGWNTFLILNHKEGGIIEEIYKYPTSEQITYLQNKAKELLCKSTPYVNGVYSKFENDIDYIKYPFENTFDQLMRDLVKFWVKAQSKEGSKELCQQVQN